MAQAAGGRGHRDSHERLDRQQTINAAPLAHRGSIGKQRAKAATWRVSAPPRLSGRDNPDRVSMKNGRASRQQ